MLNNYSIDQQPVALPRTMICARSLEKKSIPIREAG
jgi:hypothetical protein